MPESEKSLVLGFLAQLRERRQTANAGSVFPSANPALAVKSGLLVFTGKVDAPRRDWVQREREERENELLEASTVKRNKDA